MARDRGECLSYPSCARVHRAMAGDGGVLVEVLRNRYADEERETQDELGPEAVQVAELKEAQATGTCSAKNQ